MDYAASYILNAGGGIAEFTFYAPAGPGVTAAGKWYLFSVSIGNGTNGLCTKITKEQSASPCFHLYDDGSNWYGGTVLHGFAFDTPYTVRLEINCESKLGRVCINGTSVMDNIDLTTISGGTQLTMYTGGITNQNTNTAYHIVAQSVKIKYGVPEGLEATP